MNDLAAARERLRRVFKNYEDGRTLPITSVYQPDPAFPPIANYEHDMRLIVAHALAEHPADEARDAARWRFARTILAVEDIKRAAAWGRRNHNPDEAENLKADAAIDAAILAALGVGQEKEGT